MNRLKEVRKSKKLTLDDIAQQTGINRGTYNNYENGKTEPKLKTWQKLADFFNVSVAYLQGAYSKDEILKVLQDTYKKRYYSKSTMPLIVVDLFIFVETENFLIAKGVIPYDIPKVDNLLTPEQVEDFNFWKKEFNEIFDTVSLKWLLTKPALNATISDIKDALNESLATSRNKYSLDLISGSPKLESNINKRETFLQDHRIENFEGYADNGQPIFSTDFDFTDDPN